ncbi:MAG: DNA polymerase III subunit chi [Rhodospirillaceae bacterium]|nr:DNA polymerase III subunit chi [Rhodospirillaceae bacterium]
MAEVRFYHLQRSTLESVLPKFLERVVERGQRAVVMADSPERVEALTNQLWTYSDRVFLPHGNIRDGHASKQPIWLTDTDENPNGAQVLFLSDGATSARIGEFETCVELFDGNNETAVAAARDRWQRYKADGHVVIYFQQDERGSWEEKARG